MPCVSEQRAALQAILEQHYRANGWTPIGREAGGVLCASGPGGVSWFGLAVVPHDLSSATLADVIQELADRRMPDRGERCVLDLLPAAECHDAVQRLLAELGLAGRRNITLYSLTTSAEAA